MKVVPLEIGGLDTDLQQLGRRSRVPVLSWVIEHRRGLVLFDTGMHPELQTDVARLRGLFDESEVDFHPGEEMSTRLDAAGYAPTDVQYVILSHLHFDHCGGTAEIPEARLVLQRDEWEAGHHAKLVEFGVYNPEDFDIGHDRQLLDGEHDLFGDGRIVCVPTPGHTKGHQSLRLELESGPVVLTGDCIYSSAMLDGWLVPPFGHDLDRQRESMRHLVSMRDDDGCRLFFGHDAEQFASITSSALV